MVDQTFIDIHTSVVGRRFKDKAGGAWTTDKRAWCVGTVDPHTATIADRTFIDLDANLLERIQYETRRTLQSTERWRKVARTVATKSIDQIHTGTIVKTGMRRAFINIGLAEGTREARRTSTLEAIEEIVTGATLLTRR